jgi:DNA-binding transcriptional MerR regulator
MARELLSIGAFARRCRLSVKALRHYDELGLLRPAHVDAASGYRYFDRAQAPAAIAIALLRSLDVPLGTIRELLAAPSEARLGAVLERERARRARELARAESALRAIERLVGAGTVFPYDVTLRDDPAVTVLAVEGTTRPDLHVSFGEGLVRELLARFARLAREPAGPVMCLLPPAAEDAIVLRMCAAIVDPPVAAEVVRLPAASMAVARHTGPYEEIGLADHALHAWAEEHGFDPAGPLREVYLNDPAETPPEALETDVLLPLTRRTAGTRDTAAARR